MAGDVVRKFTGDELIVSSKFFAHTLSLRTSWFLCYNLTIISLLVGSAKLTTESCSCLTLQCPLEVLIKAMHIHTQLEESCHYF